MIGVAGYNLITRTILINNPFHLFFELEKLTPEEMVRRFMKLVDRTGRSDLFEQTLLAAKNKTDPELLKSNVQNSVLKYYQTELNNVLRALTNQGYITSKFLVKLDDKRHVVDIRIETIDILPKGLEALQTIQMIKQVDLPGLLMNYVNLCHDFVQNRDIMLMDKVALQQHFEDILKSITSIKVIDFEHHKKSDLVLDHYTGKIIINDFERFKKFIDNQKNHQLEQTLNRFFIDASQTITEVKIILNSIYTNTLESLPYFLSDDRLYAHLLQLLNKDFIKVDMSYKIIKPVFKLEIKKAELTEAGLKYLMNIELLKIKNNAALSQHMVLALKAFVNKKLTERKNESNMMLKNLIASDYLN